MMKLVNRQQSLKSTSSPAAPELSRYAWKVLVVDDENDVRAITRLNLRDFQFAGFGLQIIEASSAAQAQKLLDSHRDIALMLVDVVMETDDAGLKLVKYIRETQGNLLSRIIIRTGQPGIAPERYVIDNFDIDGYVCKTDLTVQRLYTTVRSAIKSYRDLKSIDLNRTGLKTVIEQTPEIYRMGKSSLTHFFGGILSQFGGILSQIVALCPLPSQ
ncbi:MAG: DUF3369 domain-containing protein [Motiliproteus sp.]